MPAASSSAIPSKVETKRASECSSVSPAAEEWAAYEMETCAKTSEQPVYTTINTHNFSVDSVDDLEDN